MSFSLKKLFSLSMLLFFGAGCNVDRAAAPTMIDWVSYGGDPGGMGYSPLDQITPENISDLEVAWTYSTGELDLGLAEADFRASFSATPLVIDGVMYFTTPSTRVIALNAETGEKIWEYDPWEGAKERKFNSNRGVAYFPGSEERSSRILFGTIDARLYSLDAETGNPDSDFGDNGYVDLRKGDVEDYDFATGTDWGARVSSPPAVYENIVITGWGLPEYPSEGPSGDVRAFDIYTGEELWRFHTIPREGEYGNDTWENDSWKNRMGANVWTAMSVDNERGLVFLPTGAAAYDFYGGDRPGENLFANSLVAVDALTGEMVWYQQLVKHDLWDYDLPSQPNLIEVEVKGEKVPAVAQTTKMGFVFLFHRETGDPIFPIEYRDVPESEVPGEQAWPKQPFPVKPEPLARTTMTENEINKLTPEIYEFCRNLFDNATVGPVFTPVGLENTITFPGYHGGSNWGGGAFDPDLGLLITSTNNDAGYGRMIPQEGSVPYRRGGDFGEYGWFRTPDGIPCQEPPFGELHAVDMSTGEVKWQVPLGFNRELQEMGIEDTGVQSLGGAIVTGGGVTFIGATIDRYFRAFETETGELLWEFELQAGAHVTPMTYSTPLSDKQFVAVPDGGGGYLRSLSPKISDEIVVFSLPD